jgi:predicted RNase H-like HicB family nuclease
MGTPSRKDDPMTEKSYLVSDGTMVLNLEPDEEGGYVVTSPFDPQLVTEAETLEEAFANAYDAAEALRKARLQLLGELSAKPIPARQAQ